MKRSTPRPKCRARAKHTGEPCGNYPPPGGVVCRFHGGRAPAAMKKAAIRNALAEALQNGDRRPPFMILADTLHSCDVLATQIRLGIMGAEEVTPDMISAFVEAIERAQRAAKLVIDARVETMMVQSVMVEGDVIAGIFLRALAAANLNVDAEMRLREALGVELSRLGEQQQALDGRPVSVQVIDSVVVGE